MFKIRLITHFVVIASLLFAGVLLSHNCLSEIDSSAEVSIIDNNHNNDSGITISLECSQTSCCHNCNHLFDAKNNFSSNFLRVELKTLRNADKEPILSEYSNLPSRPPRA